MDRSALSSLERKALRKEALALRAEAAALDHSGTVIVLSATTLLLFLFLFLFLVIALIAGGFGFTGIAGGSAYIAKVLFFVFLALLVLSLIFGKRVFK